VDEDLHLHEPGSTEPWGGDAGNDYDCAWSNCTVSECGLGLCPAWFTGAAPPDPVAWRLSPVDEENTCYFAPQGQGAQWRTIGQGCHNPRLEMQNITCDPLVLDDDNSDFCLPENINVEYPPREQWSRFAVHYYANHGQAYAVHPRVRVFCNGILVADLGPAGYYVPESPVTFSASDAPTRFWSVADVLWRADGQGVECVVRPLYTDAPGRTPSISTVVEVKSAFAPPYPASP
jgi:hypothetical protein